MGFINSLIQFLRDLFCNNKTNTETVVVENNNKVEIPENNGIDVINASATTENDIEAIIEESETDDKFINDDFKKFHVLIDNGHGKNTSGKGSPYSLVGTEPKLPYKEYAWAREIANMIEAELKTNGINAERIVPEETDITLTERVRRVNSKSKAYGVKNTILISIHSNASGNGAKWMSGHGWSAYTSKGQTDADILCEYIYKEAEKNFKGQTLRKDMTDGDCDMEEGFYMLKKTVCPAVLSENFFHDNVEDVKFITSNEGKQAVVKTHVDGIIEYFKSIKK
jgi:N-acetylmuramoyl-L-alanine amidase